MGHPTWPLYDIVIRTPRIEVLLTEDEAVWRERWEEWSDGLIRRR